MPNQPDPDKNVVTVRLHREVLALLDKIARQQKRTRSDLLRKLGLKGCREWVDSECVLTAAEKGKLHKALDKQEQEINGKADDYYEAEQRRQRSISRRRR